MGIKERLEKAKAGLAEPGPVEQMIGLVRSEKGYSLVVATIQDGKVITHDVDPVAEPLQYATRQLLNAARSMVGSIP